MTELGCASLAIEARPGIPGVSHFNEPSPTRPGTPGVLHFDEPGPALHGTMTKLGVQGDRAGPGKNEIRTNKELD